jgi:hypothetical protein
MTLFELSPGGTNKGRALFTPPSRRSFSPQRYHKCLSVRMKIDE